MNIGIDARLYGTAHGGIGRYIQELIKHLEQTDQENQYFIFLAKSNFDEYQPQNRNFTKILADYRVYSIAEQLLLPWRLNQQHLDLMHFPHFNVPFLYRQKFVVTIHDLIVSHYPDSRATTLNPLIYKIKLGFYNLVVKSAAQRASRIIAVSQFTKNDIVRLLKAAPEKITVVYEGVALPEVDAVDCRAVLAKLKLTSDFLLYVGSAYPHKNLEKLISAWPLVLKEHPDLQLVLVGKINYFYQQLEKMISNFENGRLRPKIIFTGYLSDEQLVCLYQSAKLYVFPSLIEGFGLPPLEAQSHGLPVVSSQSSCLPEILGDSAVYFDPENIEVMAQTIDKILGDSALRSRLIAQGKENIKKYSWRQTAEKIKEIYKQNY